MDDRGINRVYTALAIVLLLFSAMLNPLVTFLLALLLLAFFVVYQLIRRERRG